MGDANVSEPLEHGFSWDGVKSLSKIYKTTIDFQSLVSCLLNDGSTGKDVINGMMCGSKSCLSPSSEVSTLKLTRELPMESCSIELRECMAHHDRLVIVGIRAGARFVYLVGCRMVPWVRTDLETGVGLVSVCHLVPFSEGSTVKEVIR
jgi:hypothetical protein